MPEWVDIGPCEALRADAGAAWTAVLLPGARGGGAQAPLWVAAIAAQELGWNTLAVWDEYRGPSDDAARVAWVRARAEAACAFVGGRRVAFVAKSISSLATGVAAELSVPAIWFTPLLTDMVVVDGLRAATAPALLVGGTADPTWDGELARTLDVEVLELPDVDHGFQVVGDVEGSLVALHRAAARTTTFLAALAG